MSETTAAAVAEASAHSIDGLLATAAQATGLSDYGDRHFIKGLTALVNALPREAALNAIGEQMVYGGIVRLLSNRLRYVADAKHHPSILEERIEKPIIILGLPRTGTSKLQRVMSADPGVQRLEFWRALNPAPFPGEKPGDPAARIEAGLLVENTLSTLFPGWMARHPMEAREPDEELHIMDMSFECVIAWLFSRVPSYYAYIQRCDPRPTYRLLHAMLQYLQWQDGGGRGRPWIMKSPVHIGDLATLIETFPDAVIVHCHRDPKKVIPSFASLIEEGRRMGSDRVDPVEIGRDMFMHWADQIDRNLSAREKLPSDRIIDVRFEDIRSDVIGVIRRIYESAGRTVTPDAISGFESYDARRPEHHWGRYEYTAEHYGLNLDEIDERFTEYRRRFIDRA
ncbi:sulfotransferase family protein [Hydrocarboniphaga effusa]|uniref:sulfotransferase family protein n=1 Tax=Hydrocarboniphaga effusa TaxID=243629 RepID=UPI003BAA1299